MQLQYCWCWRFSWVIISEPYKLILFHTNFSLCGISYQISRKAMKISNKLTIWYNHKNFVPWYIMYYVSCHILVKNFRKFNFPNSWNSMVYDKLNCNNHILLTYCSCYLRDIFQLKKIKNKIRKHRNFAKFLSNTYKFLTTYFNTRL